MHTLDIGAYSDPVLDQAIREGRAFDWTETLNWSSTVAASASSQVSTTMDAGYMFFQFYETQFVAYYAAATGNILARHPLPRSAGPSIADDANEMVTLSALRLQIGTHGAWWSRDPINAMLATTDGINAVPLPRPRIISAGMSLIGTLYNDGTVGVQAQAVFRGVRVRMR